LDKSSAEISIQISEQEQLVNDRSKNRDIVKLEINSKRRDIHKTQIAIKDLEDKLIQAECLVREAKTELSILKDLFWRVKNSGL
jgi:hypothetical protein